MASSTRAPDVLTAGLLEEHRALRETLAGLEQELSRMPTPEAASSWCEAVSLRLRMLRAHLRSHFAREESGGLIEEVQRSAPEQQSVCERLLHEHAELLDTLDALVADATLRIEPLRWSDGLRGLIQKLARHEEREDELLLRALDTTPGAPD